MGGAHVLTQADWQRALVRDQAKAGELFGRSEEEQRRLGYFYTLQEICQQPWIAYLVGEVWRQPREQSCC